MGHMQSAFGEFRVKNHADYNINLEGLGGEANSGLRHRDGTSRLGRLIRRQPWPAS